MPRLISLQSTAPVGRGELNSDTELSSKQRAEDYLERIAKLVPVEIVTAFVAIRGFLAPSGSTTAVPPAVEFVAFATLVILTPIYLGLLGGPVPQKKSQLVLATVSFLVWTYGIGGPFFYRALETALGFQVEFPGLSATVVVLWSLMVGLFKPRA